MAKKIVKKTKIKIVNLLIVLLVILGLFFCCYFLLKENTKNIVIKGNNYLNDDYIIELGNLMDYPDFILLNTKSVKKNIVKSKYISNVKIHKKYNFVLEIEVVENKALFYDTYNNNYVLENNEKTGLDDISVNFRVPRLINYVPDNKYEKFVNGMEKVDSDTLSRISDIEYKPNDYDKDRFLLYMDDGNMVYLTLTKYKMINHYNEVLTQLEGHKGILYLDNGNHFKILE